VTTGKKGMLFACELLIEKIPCSFPPHNSPVVVSNPHKEQLFISIVVLFVPFISSPFTANI